MLAPIRSAWLAPVLDTEPSEARDARPLGAPANDDVLLDAYSQAVTSVADEIGRAHV